MCMRHMSISRCEKIRKRNFPNDAKEQAKFYMSVLKKVTTADGKERYVTIPAYSPEHGPYIQEMYMKMYLYGSYLTIASRRQMP